MLPPEFTPHVPLEAIAYQRAHYVVGLIGLAWSLFGLWAFVMTGCAARLRDKISPSSPDAPPRFVPLLIYFAAFVLCLTLWMLPVSLARFAIEHHFGFGRQSLPLFLLDILKSRLFDLLIVPVLWLGYHLIAKTGGHWWRWMTAILVPLLLFQFILSPLIVAPAFHRYTPLPDGEMRHKILALAAKSGITGGRVFVEDTSRKTRHVNAYVVGVGASARIVLNDTALQTLPEDQLLAMMAHEMGHYVEGHQWIQFGSSIVGAGLFLFALSRLLPFLLRTRGAKWRMTSVFDLAALPLLQALIAVFLLIQSPVENAESRFLEHRADQFALRLTGLREPMARLFVGFAERDYTDPDPPRVFHWLWGSHPTLNERIHFALGR